MFSANTSQVAAGAGAVNYIEDVFSTWLYTGTGALQTITNGIDLSTKGGLVWLKSRSATYNHYLQDTTRGIQNTLTSNDTSAQSVGNDIVNSVSTTGFVVQSYSGGNNSGSTYASWTFRKQPKFFDVVTYTGTGSATTIAHNLGSVPGCIIVKQTSGTNNWAVYHRSQGATKVGILNLTNAFVASSAYWNDTTPTDTVFSLGAAGVVNTSGQSYVAYLFAHDAGGFGLTGTDNVISCGSYTGNGSTNGPTVTLGYEPQWILIKRATGGTASWFIFDSMRGIPVGSSDAYLLADVAQAEDFYEALSPTSTGFKIVGNIAPFNTNGNTYIYIAIRRGPMKVPTSGTSVFSPVAYAGTGATRTVTAGFPVDLALVKDRTNVHSTVDADRLRGAETILNTDTTAAENPAAGRVTSFASNTSITVDADTEVNGSGANYINWAFRRAPSFFDELCYTGTGSVTTQTHNLQAIPELIIGQCRSNGGDWVVYSKAWTDANPGHLYQQALNSIDANKGDDPTNLNSTWPTSTTLYLGGTGTLLNSVSKTYVVYLFSTCTGVSKVGLYTGTGGSLQTINCGFLSGARFVLIKRVDSSSDWYVWDTARGLSSSTDPYLRLNSANAELTGTNYVDTDTTGFKVTAAANTTVNVNGGKYIFLAIA